jgi:hypothetical protein
MTVDKEHHMTADDFVAKRIVPMNLAGATTWAITDRLCQGETTVQGFTWTEVFDAVHRYRLAFAEAQDRAEFPELWAAAGD